MKKIILATAISAVVSPVVYAADPVTIVITASRTEQALSQSITPTTVITHQQLQQTQPKSVAQALEQSAGVQVLNSGGYGQNSTLYLRGLDQKRMLVLVDGVQIGSATLGYASLEHFPVEQIERIEIVRGARSSLYGANAIAGVIQIITKKKHLQSNYAVIEAGVGSRNTQQLSLSGGFGNENTRLTAAVSRFSTEGFDVYSAGGEDKDGYLNQALNLTAEHQYSSGLILFGGYQRAQGHNDYDQCSKPDWSKSNDCESLFVNDGLQLGLAQRANQKLGWEIKASQHNDSSQQKVEGIKADKFVTQTRMLNLQGEYQLSEQQLLLAGIDYKKDEVSGSGVDNYQEKTRDNKALFALWQWQQKGLSAAISGRADRNQAFGTFNTYGVELGVELLADLELTLGRATAFTAPTFNDLYYPALGNPDLKPETSSTNSLGLNYQPSSSVYLTANLYQTEVEDLVAWAPISPGSFTWTPQNVDNVSIKGVELTGQWLFGNTQLDAHLEWLEPKDKATGNILIYRAQKSSGLRISQQLDQLTLGISAAYTGSRYTDKANTDRLDAYTLVHFDAQYAVSRALVTKLSVKNLTDKSYVSKKGYETESRSLFASVSYTF
ncbi:vitamin B12 transporter [Oceanospirillum multiglobuliferum]|uniref:TonB-dependent vitamin B12 receptor n=1 Tax=Oceanospirillum multiglobuliferum TaxID=64969 RepID=A0A1T4RRN3_9GAMM|nr:TonB-dependent receptor [Oceanospirillum multiglobuliferum]OPX54696.1 hypothetical protein BTE48_13020 [Oceanospirillum multiglobuliferum]SKA18438.1 vitamin B12 transporter [Oceanospirillum multiglobuliferum]